jgi:hypothetical protein
MLDKTHPVGSLYWSSNSTNPGKLFGGTWVQIKDKFILAAGDKYGIGTTGGSADAVVVSHTHSIPSLSGSTNETGKHTHDFSYHIATFAEVPTSHGAMTLEKYESTRSVSQNGAHTHTVTTNASTTGSQGVSGAGKNMPPYEAYYCWKRTA